jgi:hypothetical protein
MGERTDKISCRLAVAFIRRFKKSRNGNRKKRMGDRTELLLCCYDDVSYSSPRSIPTEFMRSRIKALQYNNNNNNNNICSRISRETSSVFLNVHNADNCASMRIKC